MELIKLNEEQREMVELMGSTGFSPREIAEVLQYDEDLFMQSFKPGCEPYTLFRKGYLMGQLKLRQRIALDAGHGSSPAQTLLKKIYDECEHQQKQR